MFNLSPLQKPQDNSNHLFNQEKDRLPQGHISNFIFQKSPSPIFYRNNIFPPNHGFIAPKSVRKDSLDLEFKSPLIRPYNLESQHTEEKHEFLVPKTPSEFYKFNSTEKAPPKISAPSNDNFKLDKDPHDKLSSFFLDVLPKILEKHWEPILTKKDKLVEFANSTNMQKNIDNLVFLENNEDMRLKDLFTKYYLNIFDKLKNHPEELGRNEDSIKYLLDFGCKMLHDIHSLIQSCTSDYCLEILKKKNANKKVKIDDALDPMKTIIIPEPVEKTVYKNIEPQKSIQIMNQETLEALSRNLDANLRRKSKNSPGIFVEPLLNADSSPEENQAKTKRGWSEQELLKLESLSNSYYPNTIPISVLEDFSKTLGRTLNSVQSKLSKIKKKANESNPQSQGANKTSKLPIKKMIEQTLIQLSPNPATKDEIIKKMRELFYMNSYNVSEETFLNSVATLLSSQNCFTKIKGIYKLKSPEYAMTDPKGADTMKLKLRYVLSQFPDYKAHLSEIKEKFEALFPEFIANDKEKLNGITKVLSQNEEFDVSESKTKYCLADKLPADS